MATISMNLYDKRLVTKELDRYKIICEKMTTELSSVFNSLEIVKENKAEFICKWRLWDSEEDSPSLYIREKSVIPAFNTACWEITSEDIGYFTASYLRGEFCLEKYLLLSKENCREIYNLREEFINQMFNATNEWENWSAECDKKTGNMKFYDENHDLAKEVSNKELYEYATAIIELKTNLEFMLKPSKEQQKILKESVPKCALCGRKMYNDLTIEDPEPIRPNKVKGKGSVYSCHDCSLIHLAPLKAYLNTSDDSDKEKLKIVKAMRKKDYDIF